MIYKQILKSPIYLSAKSKFDFTAYFKILGSLMKALED